MRSLLWLSIVGLAAVVWFAVYTHFFGAFSIVHEPYYREVVGRITSDPAFAAELGVPLTVDDDRMWCTSIETDSVTAKASCRFPVAGPRGHGTVDALIFAHPGGLETTTRLHVGSRTIPGGS